MVEGVFGQPVDRQGRLLGIGWGQIHRVEVVDRPVLLKQTRFAVAHVMRMRKAVINEEGVLVLGRLALFQVIHDLFPVPMAALFVGATAASTVVTHSEELVGGLVAVAVLAGAHGVVAGTIEDRRQSVLGQVGRHHLGVGHVRVHDAARLIRNMPDRTPRHHHVARWRAYSAYPGSHVVSPIQHHALLGQPIDVGRVENGTWVVDLKV